MEIAMVQASVVGSDGDDDDLPFSSGTIAISIPPPSSVRTLSKTGSDNASKRSARNQSAIPKSFRKGHAAKPLMVRWSPRSAPPKQKKCRGADLGHKCDRAAPAAAVLSARTMVNRASGDSMGGVVWAAAKESMRRRIWGVNPAVASKPNNRAKGATRAR